MESTIALYKDDLKIRRELLQWMKMLASVDSSTGVTERFVMLRTFAEKMVDVDPQGEMLNTVTNEVSMLNL